MRRRKPKVIVITGSSAGIGRATAMAFARSGASVALLARSAERLRTAVQEIEEMGCAALAVPTDVSDASRVEAAAQRVEDEFGPIDVWVNCAMVTVFSTVSEMRAEEYRRVMEVTYLGSVYGTQAALKRMHPRKQGVIIQVGSALAYRGIPLQSAYCAAKFAIRGFTDSLRAELIHKKSKIHLTMVHLAAFNTPQFEWARYRLEVRPQPLPPIFQPELAASAIVWSARHRRRQLYVGYPTAKTVLGNKLFPGLADRLASKQAVSGQMDENAPPPEPGRRDNLFDTYPGDFRAHGRFDTQAYNSSWQLFLTLHRGVFYFGLLVLTLLLVGWWFWQ